MTMSSLAAQLAGLNDAGVQNRTVGSILPTSLRHDDAVGRGMHHSVAVGHVTLARTGLFQPSVLYEDAKAASDVPLTTLWENCRAALLELSQDAPLEPYASVLQNNLLSRQSPSKTKKAKTTTTTTSLTHLLTCLSTCYPLNGDACLHVLEYLLRRYNIHVTAADTLLMTVLPHAEDFPVLFHRVLQLVNIVATPCWMWLRPYARTGSDRPPPPPRHVVAKHAFRNTALLHQICTLTQTVAHLESSNHSHGHRGRSQLLSWSATLLVQGLVQLQTTQHQQHQLEPILRSLLPFCVAACSTSSGNREWTVWGHVVSSAVAETMELAPAVQQVLSCSILKGALASIQKKKSGDSQQELVVVSSDALVAVMAVCLPLHNNTTSLWNATHETFATDLWLPYPTVLGQILQLQDYLPLCLHHLWHTRGYTEGVKSLVLNIILLTVLHQDEHGDDGNLIVALVEMDGSDTDNDNNETSSGGGGLEQLWKTDDTAKDLAEWLVWTFLHDDTGKAGDAMDIDDGETTDSAGNPTKLQFYQELLQALRRVDVKGCEQGMAEAMQDTQSVAHKKKLSILLEGVLPVKAGKKIETQAMSSSPSWLPPRVALEHADPNLRLQAIQQLLDEQQEETQSDADSLQQALSRRMSSDEDCKVVMAAAKAVQQTLGGANKRLGEDMIDEVLTTLYQWASFAQPAEDSVKQQIVVQCLVLLGHASVPNQTLLEALSAHLEHWNSTIVDTAADSIIKLLSPAKGKSPKKAKKGSGIISDAKALLLAHEELSSGLLSENAAHRDGTTKRTVLALRRRSLWVVLKARADYVGQTQTPKQRKEEYLARHSEAAVEACFFLLSSEAEKETWKKNPDRTQTLKDVWQTCIKMVPPEALSDLLVSLATNFGQKLYDSIGQGLIEAAVESVTDKEGEAVAVFSVIMEAALQESASTTAVKRLIKLAAAYLQDNKKHPATWFCVVPALALLEHADEVVRTAALELLSQWISSFSAKTSKAKYWKSIVSLCEEAVKNKASATMGGMSFLPMCLASAVNASKDCRDRLLDLVLSSSVACGWEAANSREDILKHAWIPFGRASGHAAAAVVVLRAMELAGEQCFPVEQRWSAAGSPIQACLLDSGTGSTELSLGAELLSDAVVGMLKGVLVSDASSLLETVVISMGPGVSGRRKRSYSIGKGDGITYLNPYPKEMSEAIITILDQSGQNATVNNLRKLVVEKLLGRASWTESVFKTLPVKSKRKIVAELLSMLAESTQQNSVDAFLSLPLDAEDVHHLKNDMDGMPNEMIALSILADYIRSNSESLIKSTGLAKLVSSLFSSLATLSSMENDFSDEVEYVRQSLLSALLGLLSKREGTEKSVTIAEKEVTGWVDLLLSMKGNDTSLKNIRPLVTLRAKGAALSLVTALCSNFPKPVVSSLIPAMTTQIQAMETVAADDIMTELLKSTFDSVLPVYWKYASSAGLSFDSLLCAFVKSVRSISSETKRMGIYNCFIHSLADGHLTGHDDPSMGAVIAYFFAGELRDATGKGSNSVAQLQTLPEFALQIMNDTNGSIQVSSILLLLHYADSLLLMLQSKKSTKAQLTSSTSFDDSDALFPTPQEVLKVATSGTSMTAKSRGTVKQLVQLVLLTVNDILLTESVRKFIRRSGRNNTELSLRLWQDLLLLQSTASSTAAATDDDTEYWETTIRLAGESLEHIQTSMPLPTFLASATSLIQEGETDELRAGAIRLVADRAPEVRPGTPEAQLFLDMASMLVEFLKSPDKHSAAKDGSSVLQQSALVAIEHIARGHHSSTSTANNNNSAGSKAFMAALQGCADIFVNICGQGKQSKIDIGSLDDASRKLLSSAALCTATLVRVTAPRCITLLPKFMNQLIGLLVSVNAEIVKSSDDGEMLSEARIVQLCVLRALTSVADSTPQFIFPYLTQLLAPAALPSGSLRSEPMDQAVTFAAQALEKSLSTQVPARVILPVVSKSIAAVTNAVEFDVLLKLLKHSIDSSSGEELVGHLGSILKSVTTTFEFECDQRTWNDLLDSANEAILSLVMKLSENHLRRLYSSLREWRGNLIVEDSERFALRRFAFWKVSAVLGKELRTIFLPCLTSVLGDAVDELVRFFFFLLLQMLLECIPCHSLVV